MQDARVLTGILGIAVLGLAGAFSTLPSSTATAQPVCYVHAVKSDIFKAKPNTSGITHCKVIHYATGYSYYRDGYAPVNSFGYVRTQADASSCVTRAAGWVKSTSINAGGCMRAYFNGAVSFSIGPVP